MEGTDRLAQIIISRLEDHKRLLAKQQTLLDSTMKDLLGQRNYFAAAARQILKSVILPRMEELLRHFDNGVIIESDGDAGFHAYCQFAHTPSFPATVSLGISLLPEESASLTARYTLEILPVLMEYKRDEEKTFPAEGSEEAIGLWLEDRIVEFVDTYLRLEIHPLYQKDNLVIDIICGMRIPLIAATSTIQLDGRIYYFCSEHCKEAFIKKNC